MFHNTVFYCALSVRCYSIMRRKANASVTKLLT